MMTSIEQEFDGIRQRQGWRTHSGTRCKNRASERMPNLKVSFLLGCTIDLHQSASPKLNVGFSFIDFCGAATIMLQLNIASFH
jgi:hypothetical protein